MLGFRADQVARSFGQGSCRRARAGVAGGHRSIGRSNVVPEAGRTAACPREERGSVAHRDPYVAVVGEVTAPPGFSPEPESVSRVDDRVPRASFMSHGPYARDPAAITVLKQHESDDRGLYALGFDDVMGNRWFWLVAAELGEDGWAAHGVAGGSDGPLRPGQQTPRPFSVGSLPWLNLCGQWGGDTFYAGGQLHSAGSPIGRVQLTLDDGSQLEDDGVGDVSLFIGRDGKPPRTIDIYAPDGALLSQPRRVLT
jgi:hypothetical protein